MYYITLSDNKQHLLVVKTHMINCFDNNNQLISPYTKNEMIHSPDLDSSLWTIIVLINYNLVYQN